MKYVNKNIRPFYQLNHNLYLLNIFQTESIYLLHVNNDIKISNQSSAWP